MRENMTDVQKVLCYIRLTLRTPDIAEIANYLQIDPATVQQAVDTIWAWLMLTNDRAVERSILS